MEAGVHRFRCLCSKTHTCTKKPWESSLSDGRLDHLEQLVPYKMVNCSHFLPAKQNSWTTKVYSWSEISTFCSGGFDKGVESSKSNLSNLHCESQNKLLTYFWQNKPAGTDGQCYLCYSGDGAVAGHEWCWPGLPRRHGPHWTWIRGDHSVHSISMNPCLRGGIERAIPQQSKTGVVWFKAFGVWKG